MIALAYKGATEHNNTKGLLFTVTFSGNYGVQGVGDLISPSTAITDPNLDYNEPIAQEPTIPPCIINEDIGGYYCQVHMPSSAVIGVRMYAPGGGELASNFAYPVAVTGGTALLLVFIPLQ